MRRSWVRRTFISRSFARRSLSYTARTTLMSSSDGGHDGRVDGGRASGGTRDATRWDKVTWSEANTRSWGWESRRASFFPLPSARTMPDAATTNNKRTRSQTTLDQFRFNPAASPLKQARSALKNAPTTAERPQPPNPSQPTPLPPPASGADDNVQDGTMDDHHLKRPSSPGKDAALLHQPDLKRPRHAIFPPPKPSTLAHPPSTSPSSPDRRAKSVPPSPSPVPLLDLNNVPPSPRRSPTKFRIASVPPEDRRDPSPDPDSTDDPAMIIPPTANSLAFVFEHATPNRTARLAPVVTPMSPLTPLPSTLDDSVRTDPALDLDATPVPRSPKLPPLLTAQTPASESTPRASTSHTQLPATTLPPQQPKLAHPPLQSFIPRQSGVKSRMRPKGKAAAVVASTSIAPQDIAPPAKKLKNPRDTEKNHLLGTVPSTVRRTHSQKPVSRPGRAKSEAPERKPAVYGARCTLLFSLGVIVIPTLSILTLSRPSKVNRQVKSIRSRQAVRFCSRILPHEHAPHMLNLCHLRLRVPRPHPVQLVVHRLSPYAPCLAQHPNLHRCLNDHW